MGEREDVLEHELVADGDAGDVVGAVRLGRVDDGVTLPLVRRGVRGHGVVPEPDGHVHLRLLDRLELPDTALSSAALM